MATPMTFFLPYMILITKIEVCVDAFIHDSFHLQKKKHVYFHIFVLILQYWQEYSTSLQINPFLHAFLDDSNDFWYGECKETEFLLYHARFFWKGKMKTVIDTADILIIITPIVFHQTWRYKYVLLNWYRARCKKVGNKSLGYIK